jgi:hypothetical protein
LLAVTLPGYLRLGGKMVYSNESPQTNDRLSALENRVIVLEQAVGNRQPAQNPPALH